MPEDLKAHYERALEELFHQGNFDAMGEFFAPTWVIRWPWGKAGFEDARKS